MERHGDAHRFELECAVRKGLHMRRCLIAGFVTSALLLAVPLFAQTKAKAENVPVIPHHVGARTSSSCRPTSTSAKASASPPIRRATCSSTRAAATRGCSSSTRTAPTSARSARASTASSSRTRSASIAQDNIWVVDEGTNMVIKFNPEGRVVMVLGRRPEPVAGRVRQHAAGGAAGEVPLRPARPTSPGTRRATSSSPTATSTRAS